MKKKNLLISVVVSFVLLPLAAMTFSSCSAGENRVDWSFQQNNTVHDLSLPTFLWMDPYAEDPGEKRFFDIKELMKKFGLTRLEAVEIQNRYRDRLYGLFVERSCKNIAPKTHWTTIESFNCFNDRDRLTAFNDAREFVAKHRFESKWTPSSAKDAKFIVVFDLDETLFREDPKTREILMAPGWDQAMEKIKDKGGKIVIYTAKQDHEAYKILEKWKITIGNQSIPVRDYVDGIFTLNYLILQPKSRGEESALTSMKDLRIIEEDLTKTIIIDDNPSRILQFENLRYLPKWLPDVKNSGSNLVSENNIYHGPERLMNCIEEIFESVDWAQEHGGTIKSAFLPYSYAGRLVAAELAQRSFNGQFKEAVEYVRQYPQLVTTMK